VSRLLADTTPLENRDYRRLWTAGIVTVIGAQLSVVAVPQQVYEITRSSAYVGLTGIFGLVPLVVFGLWGGAGVAVLVFVFGEDVGSPPVDALLIVLSVVLASSMMQAAGGIDWMVTIAAKLIESRPKQITLIAVGVLVIYLSGLALH